MVSAISIGLSVVGYGLIYVAHPGDRAPPDVARARRRLGAGVASSLLALATSAVGFGPLIGPVLVLSTMMAVGSICVVVGPLLRGRAAGARRTG